MFRPCAGDAAPGSSQTAFGSGSLLLAPLSNFRDPAYYCAFTAFPQTRDEQSACVSGCSYSLSASSCLSALPHCITLSLLLPGFCLLSIPLLFFCLFLVLCLQDYRSAVLLTVCKSRCALPLSLISSLPLTFLVCMHLSSTHCGLVIAVSTQATFPF